jgi:magnesium chelatase subunit D
MRDKLYPFSAIVGQDALKLALTLCAVNPAAGGVLIRGEKGTAKSTAVRALARLLPRVHSVAGCPYNCNPDRKDEICPRCAATLIRGNTVFRKRPVVTLPLNATEDRVAGGLDFDTAVRSGVRALQPGVLAKAHRGILYVDEVNLLDDHIVDLVLGAAGSGENRVEREGLSVSHASRFMLVGTMNPEEGELRPQFLDRFGLCVEVVSEKEPGVRAEIMRRRELFDLNPGEFGARYEKTDNKQALAIQSAAALLSHVVLDDSLRRMISEMCAEKNCAGHRAELVIAEAARALAALSGRTEVFASDVETVAPMALLHRTRTMAPPPPEPEPEHDHEHDHDHEHPEEKNKDTPPEEENQAENTPPPQGEREQKQKQEQEQEQEQDAAAPEDPEERQEKKPKSVTEKIFEVGETFKVRRIQSPKDRVFRRGPGRRSRTRVAQKQGRYVSARPRKKSGDIALDATLRAAAPYQPGRKAREGGGLAVILRKEDLQERIRERKTGNFLLFVVDASGSMGARGRMIASKGAVMSLLLDAYQKRDKVAMVSFRKDGAEVNLPPTSSVELAARLLAEMPVGGKTPLSAGLVKCAEMLRNMLVKDPAARPIVLFVTDGRANQGLNGERPVPEAMELASRLALDQRVTYIVVDTESRGLVSFGLAQGLAARLGARYFKIEDLKADNLVEITREARQ